MVEILKVGIESAYSAAGMPYPVQDTEAEKHSRTAARSWQSRAERRHGLQVVQGGRP